MLLRSKPTENRIANVTKVNYRNKINDVLGKVELFQVLYHMTAETANVQKHCGTNLNEIFCRQNNKNMGDVD